MYFRKILLLELFKLMKKKTTYLLLITLFVPLIFGIGMSAQISFLVTDGGSSIDVISDTRISALQFTANMLSQSTYIVYLIIIIIVSMVVANEFEVGQIRLYAVRIGNRFGMVLAKVLSLVILTMVYIVIYSLTSIGIYYLLVAESKYGNGEFLSGGQQSVLYLVVTTVGIIVMVAITLLLGMFLKTFSCFAVSYLIWFGSKYLGFFDKIKLFAPDQCADVILARGMENSEILLCLGIYTVYIIATVLGACYIMKHKDMK